MAPLPSPSSSPSPPNDSKQSWLLSPAFCHHSKPPLLDRPLSSVTRLLENLASAATSHPWIGPFLSISVGVRKFFTEVRCTNRNKSSSSLSVHNFAAILPGDSVAGILVANGISNFLNIYNTLLVVRLVLTWFPNSPPAIVSPLSTICDPYLNIFRGIIPPLGGTLDLSPILAFIVLNFFTSTAAALPAELPASNSLPLSASHIHFLHNLSSAQQKWVKRMCNKVADKNHSVM